MTFSTMFSASWDGALKAPDTETGPCELCGHDGARVAWTPRSTWGAFESHAYPGEGAICQGCNLLTMDRSPIASKAGSRMLAWTLFTLATDGRSWRALTAAEKPEIARLLNDPAWAVSVTTTGKRSVAHMTPAARPPDVRAAAIDGVRVVMPHTEWVRLFSLILAAYQEGATKQALETVQMGHNDVRRLGVDRAREIIADLQSYRSTAALRLAVWVAHKEQTT